MVNNLNYTPTANGITLSTGVNDIETIVGDYQVVALGLTIESITAGAVVITFPSGGTMSVTKASFYSWGGSYDWLENVKGMSIDVPGTAVCNLTWEA